MTKEEMKNFRVTLDMLPTLLEMVGADAPWLAEMTNLEKQKLVDKINRIIVAHYGD